MQINPLSTVEFAFYASTLLSDESYDFFPTNELERIMHIKVYHYIIHKLTII